MPTPFSCRVALAIASICLTPWCRAQPSVASEARVSNPVEDPSYLAHIAAANSALRLNEAAEAQRWLNATPGAHDTWEWRFLKGRVDTSVKRISTGKWAPVRLAYSPDGTLLAVACHDGVVRLYLSDSLELVREWRVGQQAVYAARFSPDGSRLVTCCLDGHVALWFVDSGSQVWQQKSGGEGLADVAYSPDGRQVLFCSWYRGPKNVLGTVSLWKSDSGEQLWKSDFGVKPIVAVRFSHDGKWFAVGTWDGNVGVWAADSPGEPKVFDFQDTASYSAIDDIAFSDDDRFIAAATKNGAPRIWSLTGQAGPRDFTGHANAVFNVAFADEGQSLLTGGSDGVIGYWKVQTRQLVHRFFGHENRIVSLAMHPHGRTFATASADRSIRLWTLDSVRSFEAAHAAKYVYGMALSADGQLLATGGQNESDVSIWNVAQRVTNRQAKGIEGSVNYLDFGAGNLVAGGNWPGDVIVWDATTGEEVRRMENKKQGGMQQCTFSDDGHWIASATNKNQVAIWNAKTGELTKTLSFPTGCWGVDFRDDSKCLAVGDGSGAVHVFEAGSWNELWSCAGNEARILGLKFSHDGRWVAAGSENGRLCVIDAETHQVVHSAVAHSERVWTVDISPDGSRIATGSADGKVKLWDTKSGKAVLTLSDFLAGVYNVAFSTDGLTLFVNSSGGRLEALTALGAAPSE